MTWRDHFREVREEMEKDIYDLVEQVIALIVGGMLGGQAFLLARADNSMFEGLVGLFVLVGVGVFVLGVLHFVISHNRVLYEE